MKIQKYQLIERCTQDDYSDGTPRPILQQVYFDGETLRACDGYKAVVIHPDINDNDKPGFISTSAALVNSEAWDGKWVNPLVEARKAEKGSNTITLTVDPTGGVDTQAGMFSSDPFASTTKYPDFAPNTPEDPGYLFTLDVAHLLDLADALLDMSNKKGGRRHTGEGLELYWAQTHPNSITVKPLVRHGEDSKDYGVLMLLQGEQEPMSGVLSPRASGVDNADSDLPSREEYQRILDTMNEYAVECKELRAKVAELEAQAKQHTGTHTCFDQRYISPEVAKQQMVRK